MNRDTIAAIERYITALRSLSDQYENTGRHSDSSLDLSSELIGVLEDERHFNPHANHAYSDMIDSFVAHAKTLPVREAIKAIDVLISSLEGIIEDDRRMLGETALLFSAPFYGQLLIVSGAEIDSTTSDQWTYDDGYKYSSSAIQIDIGSVSTADIYQFEIYRAFRREGAYVLCDHTIATAGQKITVSDSENIQSAVLSVDTKRTRVIVARDDVVKGMVRFYILLEPS